MLEPRRTTPRRTAIKYAIVALPAAARMGLRAWVARNVDAAGGCSIVPAPVRTWLDVVQAAIVVTNAVDRAWIRAWTLKWVRAEDGSLAIPTSHSGNTMARVYFQPTDNAPELSGHARESHGQ